MAKSLPKIGENKRQSFKESFIALYYVPRFFKKVAQSSPQLFVINIIARIINAAAPILLLWVGKLIIDEIIFLIDAPEKDLSQLWIYVAIELGIAIVSDLLGRGITLTDALMGDLYSNTSSEEIIRKTAEVELYQLEDPIFYDKMERARRQTTSRVTLLSNILSQFQDLITVISLITALIVFEPWLIILLILAIIPSFLSEIKYSQKSYSLARSWTSERRELDYLRFTGASDVTAKEIKLFSLTDYIATRFREIAHNYYLANRSLSIKRSIWGGVFNLLGVIAYYGAYILIIFNVVSGILSVGELTFLSGSFNRLRTRMQGMFFRFSRISESALYLKDYFDFLDLETSQPSDIELSPVPDIIHSGIEFKNVSFGYPGSKKLVIEDVSFHLKQGEKMAFVGENGAGKTTLTKLILRFYEPTSGQILLDGIDISRFNKAEYQKMFGVIFQDFIKYSFSAGDNIAVGNIEDRDNQDKIDQSAALSLADEVIKELPEGYQQQLGKRFTDGVELSGGQWQKIALARAYMKDAKFIILDEPTSALDARAEYEAFQRFINLTIGKTAVIISHRFSTVRMADRILVLKDGKVLELGTHEELLDNGALYAELFNLQAAGYQ